ncbi:uncharacterized protein STEHIDRAFT_111139 [Stereum hirsutum FP-91666 SS1]|uniref:uncharacterized protein n=1 Tax=Stereum hirsutum (strain FP-91666) TaxID=721885 RepID=UPI000440AFFC|nr:uncharacterized protein STEHIDRAFT_111139 [Stereum hirsutum FP-91666 SS1]EIM86686.1 hypothetical protein STEHIDRAFT_111139 [Stereum hirsutum FP-91666 SS1]
MPIYPTVNQIMNDSTTTIVPIKTPPQLTPHLKVPAGLNSVGFKVVDHTDNHKREEDTTTLCSESQVSSTPGLLGTLRLDVPPADSSKAIEIWRIRAVQRLVLSISTSAAQKDEVMKVIKSEQEQALETLRASFPPSFHEYINNLSSEEAKKEVVKVHLVMTAPGTPDMISIIVLIMDGARPGDFQYSPEGRAIVREWYKRERRPVPRDLKPTRRSIGSVIRDYLSRLTFSLCNKIERLFCLLESVAVTLCT